MNISFQVANIELFTHINQYEIAILENPDWLSLMYAVFHVESSWQFYFQS